MPTVFIYTRVSSKAQATITNVSLDMQKERCVAEIKTKYSEYSFGHYFSETVSGRYLVNQIHLCHLCEIACEGDLILVYNISRFTRDASAGIDLLYKLQSRGINVASVMEQIDYKSHRSVFRQKLLEANEESDMISDRVTNANEFIRSHGGVIGTPSYGYLAVRQEIPGSSFQIRKLAPNIEEMSLITRIQSMVENVKNQNIADEARVGVCNIVADMLNAEGCLKRGKQWNAFTVKNVYLKFKSINLTKYVSPENDSDSNESCLICNESHSEHPNEMILCDKCDHGFHVKCINLKSVPKGDFYCSMECKFAVKMNIN